MSMFSKIRSFFRGKGRTESVTVTEKQTVDSGDPGDVYSAGFGGFGRQWNRGKERQWLEEFETNCHLRAPFARLAEDSSLIPWKLYREAEDGERTEIKRHPLLSLLRRPDPTMTGMLWEQTIDLQFDLVGEFFLWIEYEFGDHGNPVSLRILPPHWVINTPSRGRVYYDVSIPGAPVMRLKTSEVIWHRRPRPANPYTRGLGIAPSVDDEVCQLDFMGEFNSSFFRNGAQLGTVLGVENLGNQYDRFRKDFEDRHAGRGNAFRTAVVPGKVSVSNLSAAHKDLDFNVGVKQNRDIVRQTVGSPPEIHGQTENSNKATAQAADHLHQSYGLLPRRAMLCQAFQEYLVPLFGEPDLVLDYENPVKETEEMRLDRVDRAVARGIMTVNQALQALGLDSVPDGDVYLLPVNVRPVAAGGLLLAAQTAQDQAEAVAKRTAAPPKAPAAAPGAADPALNGGDQPAKTASDGPKSFEKTLLEAYLEQLGGAQNGPGN